MVKNENTIMLKGSNLAKSTIWNFIGILSPALAALVSVPFLIKGIGTDRFGLLTLIWVAIGYFGIFDFGIGRALTKIVAEKKTLNNANELPLIIFNASVLLALLGVISGILLFVSAGIIIDLLKVNGSLRQDGLRSIYLLSFSLPFVISSVGFRGVLEGLNLFNIVNIVKIPTGALFYLGPLLFLPFTHDLFFVVLFLLLLRIITWLLYFVICNKYVNIIKVKGRFQPSALKPLLSFGGWLTITNIISPLLVNFDRYVISGLLTISVVAYYTTSLELVVKFWMIPGAIVSVLFPAFTSLFVTDKTRARDLFLQGIKYVFIFLFPLALLFTAFSREILALWLGADFASKSFVVLQLLSVGAFIYGINNVPAEFINSVGIPQYTAILRLAELPLYVALLYYLTIRWGIAGAAIAWDIRIFIDTILLFWKCYSVLEEKFNFGNYLLVISIISFGSIMWIPYLWLKLIMYCLTILSSGYILWSKMSEGEIMFLKSLVGKFTNNSISE